MKQKISLYVPEELEEKLNKTSSLVMVSKSSVIKLAINEYCEKILNK